MTLSITALGDGALLLHLTDPISTPPHAVAAWLRQMEGVSEVIPAAISVTVVFDAIRWMNAGTPTSDLATTWTTRIQRQLAELPERSMTKTGRTVEIPVCYGGEYGPDFEEVAQRCRMSIDEVIAQHSAAEYTVQQLGFAPGFPYLQGLHASLRLPRRDSPRTAVPAGSVAIANDQTCIYPVAIAGGWHLIGRTPLRLFDSDRDPPALLEPGDRVVFRSITPQQFATWNP